MRAKAADSRLAAEMLAGAGRYASAVSRAYYSAFQFTQSALMEALGMTEPELGRLGPGEEPGGSHKLLRQRMRNELEARGEVRRAQDFSRLWKQLQDVRIIADYKDAPIGPETAKDMLAKARQLVLLLNQVYP